MPDIIPAIFEKDWDEIAKKIALVSPHAEWVQIDIADGSLAPTTTFLDFAKFAPLDQLVKLEAHLMVSAPEKYIRPLVDAGFKRIIAHVECNDPRLFLDEMEKEDVEAGLAIDGPTPVETIEPFLENLDVVLVMMAEMGASGMKLQSENIEKIRAIHAAFPDLSIEAEEGVDEQTAKVMIDAGASRLVVSPDTDIEKLKKL